MPTGHSVFYRSLKPNSKASRYRHRTPDWSVQKGSVLHPHCSERASWERVRGKARVPGPQSARAGAVTPTPGIIDPDAHEISLPVPPPSIPLVVLVVAFGRVSETRSSGAPADSDPGWPPYHPVPGSSSCGCTRRNRRWCSEQWGPVRIRRTSLSSGVVCTGFASYSRRPS